MQRKPPTPSEAQATAATRSERTRATILEAALLFLQDRPFRDMSVRSLMERTPVSRPAFYQYFRDVHDLMETLLDTLRDDILSAASPWFLGTGDPVALLVESLSGLVHIVHDRSMLVRAVTDAAPTDRRLEAVWRTFLGGFDDAVAARIRADQAQGLIDAFDPHPVAVSFNRISAYAFVEAFAHPPESPKEPILEASVRIWVSALFGSQWVDGKASDLRRR